MRKYGYLAFDVVSIALMLFISLYLRNGMELIEAGQPGDLKILTTLCFFVSICVLPLFNTHNRLWRYTSASDLSAIMIAVTLIVLLSNGGLFLFNRLDIVPRSVPPMHWALSVFMLCGSRLVIRRIFGGRRDASNARSEQQHVLILGTGHVAELYLDFVKRIIPGQVIVEGLIDENPALVKRSFHQHEILGTPENLESVIEQFMVHGIRIQQLVLAQPFESFSITSKQHLLQLERTQGISLVHFQKQIGISETDAGARETLQPQLPEIDLRHAAYPKPFGVYPKIKRAIDVVGALSLMVLVSPLLLLGAVLAWIDVGLPILFWQQRPGRFGKPFRLYKFRTMRPARRRMDEDRLAHKTGDAGRTSLIGYWLRRLHIDELPQLFHILSGTMSFIGPRPLLPDDQPEGGSARLSIRPGITGWAQVHGGDELNAEQKLVLDLWYIQNMSLWLDVKIIFKTLYVACTGDRPAFDLIDRARQSLHEPYTIDEPSNHAKQA